MKESLKTSFLMGKEHSNGKTKDLSEEDGRMDKCMDTVYLLGQTATNTKVSMLIVESRGKGHSIGTMGRFLLGSG